MASGKVPIFVINLDAVTDSKLGVGFEEWEKEREGRSRSPPSPPLQPIKRMLPKYPISGTPFEAAPPAQGNPGSRRNDKPDMFR